MSRRLHSFLRGFSLVEAMVVIAVIGIIAAIAAPNIVAFIDNQRLINAAEFVYERLQFAKLEAAKQSKTIRVVVSTSGANWAIGVTDLDSCNPLTSSPACTITPNGSTTATTHQYNGTEFPNISITDSTYNATTPLAFDPYRGTANSGGITVSHTNGQSLRSVVSIAGRIRLCIPSGSSTGRYSSC